jgi:ubiquinone biosynthesis protein
MIDPEKSSLLRTGPRLLQILRVLARHKFLGALRGKGYWLPALGIDAVCATVEAELGAPLSTIFAEFSATPLAAATIAQVHEATLHNGRHVAVKVQRPDLEEMIATDISALTYLVTLGESLFPRQRLCGRGGGKSDRGPGATL